MTENLALFIGWPLALFIGFLELVVIWKVATNQIDIRNLLDEPDGTGASFSRFQFLIFTFVIAMSLFWVVVRHDGFPEEIPSGIFTLLGISGGTYAISKGLQPNQNAPKTSPPTSTAATLDGDTHDDQ